MSTSTTPDVAAWLHELAEPDLRALAESAVKHVPAFRAYVEQAATQATQGDVGASKLAVRRLPGVGWFEDDYDHDWHDWPDTSGYADQVRETLAPLLTAAEARPAPALLPLLQNAITTVCEVLADVDDWDGAVSDVLEELITALHQAAAACASKMSDTDRTALADWLWGAQSSVGEYSSADLGVDGFVDALGPAGVARYRALVDAADAGEWRVQQARRRLAVLDGDPAAVLDPFGGALDSAHSCLAVVRPLCEIGESGMALDYARKGFAIGSASRSDGAYAELADLVVEDARLRGDRVQALELRQQAYQAAPGRDSYTKLRKVAGDEWPRLAPDAEALMQEQCPREWEEELLDQGRVDEAWHFVNAHEGVLQAGHLRDDLLLARGESHPADVLPLYQVLVDAILVDTGRYNYETAGRWLVAMRGFADAADQAHWFNDYLVNLWEGARRRPACREIFTRLRLVPAAQ